GLVLCRAAEISKEARRTAARLLLLPPERSTVGSAFGPTAGVPTQPKLLPARRRDARGSQGVDRLSHRRNFATAYRPLAHCDRKSSIARPSERLAPLAAASNPALRLALLIRAPKPASL